MFVVVRNLVNIDGQVFSAAGPGKDADIIPKELEGKLTAHDRKYALRVAGEAPSLSDAASRTQAAPAVAAEVKK